MQMTDLFADDMPGYMIEDVLEHCGKYPNQYLFQTKNPGRFYEYYGDFPGNTILGTTIETNRKTGTKAPQPIVRYGDMVGFHRFKKMVSIEPIMDVDIDVMVGWIGDINPLFVSIGADSKKHNLKEPTGKKIRELIVELKKIAEVRIKKNLKTLFEREKYWYVSNTPRICTNCKNRIKIGMTYYIPPGAGVLCSDCGQKHLETRKKEKI